VKRTPMRRIGKVGARRARNMAKWKKSHPVPAFCPICKCGPDFRGFECHHHIRRSQCGDESEGNLIWLCCRCHDKTKGGKAARQEMRDKIEAYFKESEGE